MRQRAAARLGRYLLATTMLARAAPSARLSRVAWSPRLFAPRALASGADAAGVGAVTDEDFMRTALAHARFAYDADEVPVGAVLVDMATSTVLAAAGNCVEASHDATAHAEILCMRRAAAARQSWRLMDCTLYCTLEPCPMCTAALRAFRIGRLVYGAPSERLGAISGSMRSDLSLIHI